MKGILLIILLTTNLIAQETSNQTSSWSISSLLDFITNTPDKIQQTLSVDSNSIVCQVDHSEDDSYGVKSWENASKYFKCFSRYSLSETQISIIKTAAKHYKINDIMMACLFLIESRFNHRASSGVAFGLVQLTPATLSSLKVLNTRPKQSAINACNDNPSPSSKVYCDTIKQRVKNSKSIKELTTELNNKNLISGSVRFDMWDKHSSIVLSAMYMQKLIEQVREKSKHLIQEEDSFENEMTIVKMALAGYNMGPGNVRRVLRRQDSSVKIKDALAKVKSISKESAGHMDGIERCIKDKVFEGPTKVERNQICK